MTFKNGFKFGIVFGFIALLIEISPNFASTPLLLLTKIVAGAFFILTLCVSVYNAMYRKASWFGTTGDGFIVGFTIIFDIIVLARELLTGHWPDPLESLTNNTKT
jgi:hypothetical protein